MLTPIPEHSNLVVVQCAEQYGLLARILPIVQVGLTVVQIGLVTWLTLFTFRRSERQKIEERRAAFFHTLIIDNGLSHLTKAFEEMRAKLQSAAVDLDKHRAHWTTQKVEETISEATTDYSVNVSTAMRQFALRVNVMDPTLAQELTRHCDTLEGNVTDWFRKAASRQGFEGYESLTDLLMNGENQIYRLSHAYEFEAKKTKNKKP